MTAYRSQLPYIVLRISFSVWSIMICDAAIPTLQHPLATAKIWEPVTSFHSPVLELGLKNASAFDCQLCRFTLDRSSGLEQTTETRFLLYEEWRTQINFRRQMKIQMFAIIVFQTMQWSMSSAQGCYTFLKKTFFKSSIKSTGWLHNGSQAKLGRCVDGQNIWCFHQETQIGYNRRR